MKKQIKVSILFTAISTVSLGIIYPLLLAGVGLLIPSAPPPLLLKPIESKGFFQGRPSASGRPYSGASNLSITSQEIATQVGGRLKRLRQDTPGTLVPCDLLFASGSGYDAHISPKGALFQISRIAKARNRDEEALKKLVRSHTQPKLWGFIGAEKVNVIELNKSLELLFPR